MQKHFYFLLPLFVIATIFLTSFGDGDPNSDYPSGAPAGYTGSPADGQNCTSCHNGSAANLGGIITSDIPAQGYTPGSDYTITVTLTGSGKKGFEVSPQTTGGSLVGTLTAGGGNKLVGNGKYCTHSSAQTGSTAVWTFTWTAPAAGTGDVTFYGAFTITKPVTKLSTLVVNENTSAPLSATATATPSAICFGNTSQLNVTATGGSGTYTYAWTSNPPGFSSTLQNPVVAPSQTTQYIVQVNDGTLTITDTTQVSVTLPPSASAGPDTTYCVSVTEIPLQGIASGYSSVSWATSGDGNFGNAGNLVTSYFPGSADRSNGSVNLILTALPLSPCATPATSTRTIHFTPCGVGFPGLKANPDEFSVYPNPSSGIINVTASALANEAVEVRIFDIGGNIVYSENILVLANKGAYSVDLSALAKGIYFIRIIRNSGIATQKIILQ